MTIFSRVLMACFLPLIVIFIAIIVSINNIVYNQVASYADEKAKIFATETAMQIGDKFDNVKGLIEVVESHLSKIDPRAANAPDAVSAWIMSMLNATPYIHCIWVSYEPGEFLPGERFSRDFVKLEAAAGVPLQLEDIKAIVSAEAEKGAVGTVSIHIDSSASKAVAVVHNLDDENLEDPESAPWYYYPFNNGAMWFETADYYDYGLGFGRKYTGTVSMPIKRNGKAVGVVGIDMFYGKAFKFIDERQKPNEQLIMVVTADGDIVYSPDSDAVARSIFDMSFAWKDAAQNRLSGANHSGAAMRREGRPSTKKEVVQEHLTKDRSFSFEDVSPFHGVRSKIYFHPISDFDTKSKQLYLYVDMPLSALFSDAEAITKVIVMMCVIGLAVLAVILFFTIRGILRPVKMLTDGANKIAKGDKGFDLGSILSMESSGGRRRHIKDEVYIMFIALRNMQRELVETEQIRAISAAKSDFLARMSHEIRTPMNAITGMAELALREDMSPAAQEHVLTIKQASASLLSLINDILDLSKIESGKLEIIPAEYELSSLVHDVVSIIRMRVVNSKVRFIVNVDSKIPNRLYGDEVRIRQILLNLLSNAVKYTDIGFISLKITGVADGELSVVRLTISVADSGKGIREGDIGKLFGDFVQVDTVSNRGIEGTGLGLAITKNLVNAMGGDIYVKSEYGKGSEFTVTLPQKICSDKPFASVDNHEDISVLVYERRDMYAESMIGTLKDLGVECTLVKDDSEMRGELMARAYTFVFVNSYMIGSAKDILADTGSAAKLVLLSSFGDAVVDKGLSVIAMPAHSVSVANVLNGVDDHFYGGADVRLAVKFNAPEARVLVVDDIVTNLKVAEGLLAPYGMKVDSVTSGAQAVSAAEETCYDLILMDHMMPGMDGLEAAKRIRERGCGNSLDVPIIALTANAVAGAKDMFIKNGFNDFISKPIDVVKLNNMLEKWIPWSLRVKPVESIEGSAPLVAGIAIDGVDVGLGLTRSGGTLAGYLRTLAIYSRDGWQKAGEIRQCIELGDIKNYITYIHGLKSVSANIGALELSAAAKALEAAARRDDRSFVETHTPVLLANLEQQLKWIDAIVAAEKEKRGKVMDVDMDALAALLADLGRALHEIDPGAIKTAVAGLKEYENAEGIGGSIEKIQRHVLSGEYDEAIELIDTNFSQPRSR